MSPRIGTFPWLTDWTGDLAARENRYNQQIDPFLERWGGSVPGEIRQLVRDLKPVYREILSELAAAPATLIHADLHLDNVTFGGPNTATVIDWQGIARGPAAYDLAVFLAGALDPDVRRAAESTLMRGYHQTLVQHGVSGYGLNDLLHDYRLALLCILAGNVNWLGSVDLAGLAGRELALVNAVIGNGRLFAALLDSNAGELIAR